MGTDVQIICRGDLPWLCCEDPCPSLRSCREKNTSAKANVMYAEITKTNCARNQNPWGGLLQLIMTRLNLSWRIPYNIYRKTEISKSGRNEGRTWRERRDSKQRLRTHQIYSAIMVFSSSDSSSNSVRVDMATTQSHRKKSEKSWSEDTPTSMQWQSDHK